MKICDATQFYSEVGGGVRRYLTEKRNYILKHTTHEHVLVIPGDRTEVIREGRLTTCKVRSPKVNRTSRYRILLNTPRAEELIAREKPDLIEAGDPYHLGWRMIDAGHRLGIPVVGFYHSHFPEAYLRTVLKYCGGWLRDVGMAYARDYICRLYNNFDNTLVPSQFLSDLLREWGIRHTVPVHLGVDTDVFHPDPGNAAVRSELGFRDDSILLLYVGRLAGEKNTRVLLDTFKILARDRENRFEFLIMGDGGLRQALLDTQAKLPQLKWISYCGDPAELARYYRMADLFVHPGVCETFGLVTMESQACGCPVVGIRGSYMDANIFAGLEYWADENKAAALARAIRRYSKLDRRKLGSIASGVVRERYGWTRVFEKIISIYEDEIRRKRASLQHGALFQED